MKKTLLIAMMALAIASCTKSPEQIAQQLIKKTFTEDPQTAQFYEPISFGTLDSVFTTLDGIKEYANAKQEYQHCIDRAEMFHRLSLGCKDREDYEGQLRYLEMEKEQIENAETQMGIYTQIQDTFKTEFKGWKMNHKFNVNNGIVVPFEVDIYFNKELTEVVGRGEVK
jgi:hypothetical protein